jgi:RNA polymerase primary sigma factor
MSAEEELRLASRLADCRRELLAIRLSDPGTSAALENVSAEVAARVLRIESHLRDPVHSAWERFLAFREAAGELAREASACWQNLPDAQPKAASASQPVGGLATEVDSVLGRSLRLVDALPFDWDAIERLILSGSRASAPAAAESVGGMTPPPASLQQPTSLQQRAWLQQRASALEVAVARIEDRFIRANQALVAHVSQRYLGLGLSRDDLMQEGNIGLLRAVHKFDARRGTPFGPYAIWWVREAMRRALAKQSRTIRIPVHALAARYTLGQASKRLAHELGREPSEQELAQATGVEPESVANALSLVREPLSLDAPRDRLTEATLGDGVADRGAPNPNERIAERERASQLQDLLEGLTPREQQILILRFGLDGAEERTLEEIGRSFDITRERVRQIVAAALEKLQRQTRGREFALRRVPASETRRGIPAAAHKRA